jgi:hypothetical protein
MSPCKWKIFSFVALLLVSGVHCNGRGRRGGLARSCSHNFGHSGTDYSNERGVSSPTSVQLNQKIMECNSMVELCRLVEEQASEFSCDAANSVRTVLLNSSAGLPRNLLTKTLEILERRSVSKTEPKRIHTSSSRIASILERGEMRRSFRQSSEITSSLCALARRHYRPFDSQGERLLHALDQRAEEMAGEFGPQEISNMLWAYAELERHPGEGLLHVLDRRAEELAGDFNPQEVSCTLWAYAKMGRQPGERLLYALERRALEMAGAFKPLHVANTLWAYANMERKVGEGLLHAIYERTEEISEHFSSHEIVKALWAYAKMGQQPREVLFSVLDRRTEEMIEEFDPLQVSSTIWAYAKMAKQPGKFVLRALDQLMKGMAEELQWEGVANILWAHARMGSQPGEGLVLKLVLRAEELKVRASGQLDPLAVANTLWAVCFLSIRWPLLACRLSFSSFVSVCMQVQGSVANPPCMLAFVRPCSHSSGSACMQVGACAASARVAYEARCLCPWCK